MVCWAIYTVIPESIAEQIDDCIFLSALVVVLLVRLSYPLKFCIWYRIQCVLPLLPQSVNWVDAYVYDLTDYLVIVNYSAMFLIFTLSLINTYKVFINPTSSYA